MSDRQAVKERLSGELGALTAHLVLAGGAMFLPCLFLLTMTSWSVALGTWLFTTVMALAYGFRCELVGRADVRSEYEQRS